MSKKKLMRYDATNDELVPVTQEWVDNAQRRLGQLAAQREKAREVLSMTFADEKVPA